MNINFSRSGANLISAASLAGALLTAGCGSEKAEPVTIEPPEPAAEAGLERLAPPTGLRVREADTNSAMKAEAAEKGPVAAPRGLRIVSDN